MVDADKKPFAEAVQALAATFRVESTRALLLGYWLGLRDLELADVQGAAEKALQACKFMPAPAELRELAKRPHPLAAAGGSFLQGVGWVMPFEDDPAEKKHRRLRANPRPANEPSGLANVLDAVTPPPAPDPRSSWPAKESPPAPEKRLSIEIRDATGAALIAKAEP